MLGVITNNPYRVLGVLSNTPLKERIGNQSRLAAFAKVGKEASFPNDFVEIISENPLRTSENISNAQTALNLDKGRLKNALFWFIKGSQIDEVALKYLQVGNQDKARELLGKKESFSSLINVGVLNFICGNYTSGFTNISMVIHNNEYRAALLNALGIESLTVTEDEMAAMFIEEIIKEVPASTLLSAAINHNDKALISKTALDEPISAINTAIAAAKSVNGKDANANLQAGTKLMNSTKSALKQIKDIAGASSPHYQMAADSLAKQILQCGINYYNNASDEDVESPRKAMVLQSYALAIAVGQLTKDRCKENYNILKQVVDSMPPAEVAIETRKVKEELRKFCLLPDKISHSVTLLNNTKPLLQTIKSKLGASNSFYLSISTQVVGNALHNIIEEVNAAQNAFGRMIEESKRRGINPSLIGSTLLDIIKPVVREAWKATVLMDSFDLEYEFKTNRYNPNRQSLKKMCDDLDISIYEPSSRTSSTTTTRPTTTTGPTTTMRPTTPCSTSATTSSTSSNTSSSSSSNDGGLPWGCWVTIIITVIIFLANVL